MSRYGTPIKDRAIAIAADLTAKRVGLPAAQGPGRTVTRYIVNRYQHMEAGGHTEELWGVTERWTYDDRPDLGEFGGGFIDLRGHPE